MLNRPGDLIPVTAEAAKLMAWSNRSSRIFEYLHRGPVTFSTLVYDTNVGDIATIASYFNPEMVSLEELNNKYAQRLIKTGEQEQMDEVQVPRLLVYPNLSNQSSIKVINCSLYRSSSIGTSHSIQGHDDSPPIELQK